VQHGPGHGGDPGRYDRLKETAIEHACLLSQVGIERGAAAVPLHTKVR
jgi:protease II